MIRKVLAKHVVFLFVVLFSQTVLFAEQYYCLWSEKVGNKDVFCSRIYDSEADLKKHLSYFHIDRESRPNRCFWNNCREYCGDLTLLKYHVLYHIESADFFLKVGEKSQETPQEKPKKKPAKKTKKKKPVYKKHEDADFVPANDSDGDSDGSDEDAKNTFVCKWMSDGKKCTKTHVSFESLYQHILDDHSKESNLACCWMGDRKKCNYATDRGSNFKRHLTAHAGFKPHVCTWKDREGKICGETFNQKHHFNSHYRTHTGERPFGCSGCKMTFTDKSNAQRHLLTHKSEDVKVIDVDPRTSKNYPGSDDEDESDESEESDLDLEEVE